jgi:LemA protein
MFAFFAGILVVIVLVIVIIVVIYNKLVASRNAYKNAFSQISVQTTRRYDLIPNLVAGVKAYLKHENETLRQVTEARNIAREELQAASQAPGDARLMHQFSLADSALTSALSRLMMVVEAYPDLKASENIQQLNEEISSTENRVAFARQAYNDEVMTFNTLAEQFPMNIVAQTFGFKLAAFLEGDKEKSAVPKVEFSNS